MSEVTPPSLANGAALQARNLSVRFGGVHAVDGVDLMLTKSEILGLIGPNGAGKSTLVNALSGFQRPTSGTVILRGSPINAWSSHERAGAGLIRSFQAVRLFRSFTVEQNLLAGALGIGLGSRAARARVADVAL